MSELDLETTLSESLLMRDTLATLQKHYPNHIWSVDVDGGLVTVKTPYINGAMGFVIKQRDICVKRVIMAGGEILERHRQRRGKADLEALRALPRNIRGDAVPLQ